MAGFFGVAAREWDVEQKILPLKTISKYVFLISLFIILIILTFAIIFVFFPELTAAFRKLSAKTDPKAGKESDNKEKEVDAQQRKRRKGTRQTFLTVNSRRKKGNGVRYVKTNS